MNNSEIEIMESVIGVEKALESFRKYRPEYISLFMENSEEWSKFYDKIGELEELVWSVKWKAEEREERENEEAYTYEK